MFVTFICYLHCFTLQFIVVPVEFLCCLIRNHVEQFAIVLCSIYTVLCVFLCLLSFRDLSDALVSCANTYFKLLHYTVSIYMNINYLSLFMNLILAKTFGIYFSLSQRQKHAVVEVLDM